MTIVPKIGKESTGITESKWMNEERKEGRKVASSFTSHRYPGSTNHEVQTLLSIKLGVKKRKQRSDQQSTGSRRHCSVLSVPRASAGQEEVAPIESIQSPPWL